MGGDVELTDNRQFQSNKLNESTPVETIVATIPVVYTPLPARFLTKMATDAETGCWHWLGAVRESRYKDKVYSYPAYAEDGTPEGSASAHRYSYKVHKGEIPAGLEIDHTCQNKLCVNPDHLEAVTHQENCRRRPKSGPSRTPGSQRDQRQKGQR